MKKKDSQLLTGVLTILFLIILIRNAWISDDAYISFRAIENFVAGYGPNFNSFIRVQVYTHPLWVLLLSAGYFIQVKLLGLSTNVGLYLLVTFLSILISGTAVFLTLKKIIRNNLFSKLLFGIAIISSKAFIDYSTSGLENPLTHFLLAIFLYLFFRTDNRLFELAFVAALLAVNRQDTILLILPALIFSFISAQKSWKKKISTFIFGFLPLILWELFSLFYYGFLFPNTAYAKLNTGIPKAFLITQGIDYFINSIAVDPVTLLLIAFAGIGIAIERDKRATIFYSGVLLYLIYIISIGGDFMSGRFFATPFFVAIILFSRMRSFSSQTLLSGLAIIIFLSAFSYNSPVKSIISTPDTDWSKFCDENGVDDEKAVYFNRSSLAENGVRDAKGGSRYAGEKWIYTGMQEVVVEGALGLFGYQQGPNIYAIDQFALADPLLARLPVEDKVNWRIGHFERKIPEGYLTTL
ncbi:hypothetical protein KAH27_01365, partial [bacterium]|nr:hypothetical protein [bacterium]